LVSRAPFFSRVGAGFLSGVTPTDAATLATMAAVLLGAALAASWIPAREGGGRGSRLLADMVV
jgi:hypothetical protein